MKPETPPPHRLALDLATAWSRLEARLSASVSLRGVSFAEFRLLRTLADLPGASATRVDLASALGMSPSGVTRALQPLEKIGVVTTVRSERDARLALAALTEAGREVVADCSQAVDDALRALLAPGNVETPTLTDLVGALAPR
ncbi:MAG: MarR family transcriptional regulator [Planctomycetota bacterium]